MKKGMVFLCLVLLLLELACFALSVPDGSILESAEKKYVEETLDEEYDFL